MKKLAIAAVVLALAATACAEGEVASDDAASTTVASAAETTTTTTAPTTSTEPTPDSTTTVVDGSTGSAAFESLLDTISNAPDVTSARMEVTVSMTGLDDPDLGVADVTFGFVSAFDTVDEVSSFLMDFSSMGEALESSSEDPFGGIAAAFMGPMEVRQIGDTAYVSMPFFSEMLGVSTPWLSMPAEDGADFSSGFSTVPEDPTDVMTAYEGADVTVDEVGTEQVDGVDTTHYVLSFDTSAWLSDLTATERQELMDSGLLADGVLAMDVWVSGEGQLIRLLFELDGSSVEMPPGEGFDSMRMQYDMFDINAPVAVEAPPASEVTPVEDLGLGDFDFGFDA